MTRWRSRIPMYKKGAKSAPSRGSKAKKPSVDGVRASFDENRPLSLKTLGEYLSLSPATISLVVNHAAGVEPIAENTKLRVLEAVKKFGYRPNYHGRALKSRRTFSVGVIVPQLNDGYCGGILEGIETLLMEEGYIPLIASHRR